MNKTFALDYLKSILLSTYEKAVHLTPQATKKLILGKFRFDSMGNKLKIDNFQIKSTFLSEPCYQVRRD